jgi:tRNA (mo5U34)-methyltransferase
MITISDAWTQPDLPWLSDLVTRHQSVIDRQLGHGDLKRWSKALSRIPETDSSSVILSHPVGLEHIPDGTEQQLENALRGLMPWRKGPFKFGPIELDTEWRSDLKWDRLHTKINLADHRVLDVGSGSGYHLWRMLEAGASEVLGIDPSVLFHCQFAAIKSLLGHPRAASIPVKLEEFDAGILDFDTIFSMGVLYHRKDPINHLEQLKRWIKPGGQLILETLVIDGEETTCLVPQDRYARMNNVWFLPSVATLARWLERVGFESIECLDVSVTTTEEQRKTDWMQFESFEHAIDPENEALTIEGLQRPTRAALRAVLSQT